MRRHRQPRQVAPCAAVGWARRWRCSPPRGASSSPTPADVALRHRDAGLPAAHPGRPRRDEPGSRRCHVGRPGGAGTDPCARGAGVGRSLRHHRAPVTTAQKRHAAPATRRNHERQDTEPTCRGERRPGRAGGDDGSPCTAAALPGGRPLPAGRRRPRLLRHRDPQDGARAAALRNQ